MNATDATRFCIMCGKEFVPGSDDALVCPACGGPPERTVKPVHTQLQQAPAATQHMPAAGRPLESWEREAAIEGRSFPSESELPLLWEPNDSILGIYKVRQRIESGGMAVVYQVRHKTWNIDLAVKVPRPRQISSADGLATFIAEAENWIGLDLHPHIVTCYYVRKMGQEGVPRVFAEWVAGGSLLEWIAAGKPGDLPQIIDAAIQFAWGLAFAHEKELVHRDVKPENVLVTTDGVLKVTDFGLTNARKNYFTPEYAAPEQILGQESTHKTDIWAWGLSFLHMISGERRWHDGSIALDLLESALQAGLDIPASLQSLLRDCFRSDPDERPADMHTVADRLIEIYRAISGKPYGRAMPEAATLRAGSLNNKALSMLDLGRPESAAAYWEQALKIDARHPDSVYNYGLTRWRNGLMSDETLIEQLEFCLSTHPLDWQVYYNLGTAHIERGDLESAAAAYRQAAEIGPQEPRIQESLQTLDDLAGATCTENTEVDPLTSFAFRPEGNQACTAGQGSLPVVWNLNSGKPTLRITRLDDSELPVITISPDGRFLLEGGYKEVNLWDLGSMKASGTRKLKNPHTLDLMSSLRALAISPDSRYALIGEMEGTITVYDLENREEINYLPEHNGDVRYVGFSQDGKWGLSAGDDGYIRVTALANGETLHKFKGPPVWSLAISNDGRWIVSACRDQTLRLYDLESDAFVRAFMGHKDEVRCVAISPDSQTVISGGEDNTFRVWEMETGRCLRSFYDHTATVIAALFLPQVNGALTALSAAENGILKKWRLSGIGTDPGHWAISIPAGYAETAALARTGRSQIDNIRAALDSGALARARSSLLEAQTLPGFKNDSELLALYDRLAARIGRRKKFLGAAPCQTIKENVDSVDQIAVTNDGRYLILDGRNRVVWDLSENRFLYTVPGSVDVGTPPRPIVVSEDSRYLVVQTGYLFSPGNEVKLWDLEAGAFAQVFPHEQPVLDFQLHPNGAELVTLSRAENKDEREIHVWDLASGEKVRRLFCPLKAHRILLSGSGQSVIAALYPGSVIGPDGQMRDHSGLVVMSLQQEGDPMDLRRFSAPCAVSPDPRFIMASGREELELLDIERGESVRPFSGGAPVEGRSTVMKFSHDGRRVYAPHENTIGFWDVLTGDSVGRLTAPAPDRTDFTYLLPCKGDAYLLGAGMTAYEKSSVYLWHLDSEELLQAFDLFTSVMSIATYANDRFLVCSGEKDIRIWKLDWEYDFPEFRDWDERARPFLENFLRQRFARGTGYTDADFQELHRKLGVHGLGWLRQESVRRKLDEIAQEIS